MSGELEAAGALATAGAVAGAIEGREGGPAGDGACLNCGAKLEGPYCSQCGQHGHPHRKLSHVLEEIVHGVVHFDTKAWRTLPMVIFRPGTLTRNYVYGQRARYISPIALFLFTIFFMFFVFAFAMPEFDNAVNQLGAASQEQLDEARQELAQAQTELEAARTNPDPDQPAGLEEGLARGAVQRAQAAVQRIEGQLAAQREMAARQVAQAEAQQDMADQQVAQSGAPPAPSAGSEAAPAEDGANVNITINGQTVPADSTWQEELRAAVDRGDVDVNLGNEALNEKVTHSLRNPDLALYKVQQAAYKFSFLLAPLSLPFIALLFLWKRGVTLYDHMAYALYALSFASLLFVAVVLTAQVSWLNWLPLWLVFLGLPVHTYFHLKGAYALGWWSAGWRTLFMLIFATIIASLFITIIFVLGLAG